MTSARDPLSPRCLSTSGFAPGSRARRAFSSKPAGSGVTDCTAARAVRGHQIRHLHLIPQSAGSMPSASSRRLSMAVMASAAHSLSVVSGIARSFSDASARRCGGAVAATTVRRGAGLRAHQKGERGRVQHDSTFAQLRLVVQLVGRLDFFKGAALEEHPLQREFPLMQRLDAPATVHPAIMRTVRTYREACRVCRRLSARRAMKLTVLADEAGLISQHVSDYFNPDDKPRRRSLPPEKVAGVESVFGNTAISQWQAARAKLTVAEESQAEAHARRVAA